ncbi:MAG: hypothetical protein JO122_07005 [Acetobacteraceae bacterium]|nr:hypothetical protein [Acetobacteraceae bacterium]
MEDLMAAVVVGQPFPDGEQRSRQIVQFDPELNPFIGRSGIAHTTALGGHPRRAQITFLQIFSICPQIYNRVHSLS